MLSINDIKDFAANSIYGLNPCHDRWKFTVTMPGLDRDILIDAIKDNPHVAQNSIVFKYENPSLCTVTFEVTSPGFSEKMTQVIIKMDNWHYVIDYIPGPLIANNHNINGVNTYFINEKDIKMPKVKTRTPTHYPSFRKFTKVIRSGPVTVAWIEGKKFTVRKTKKDKDDLEKAMLMLFAKSQFSSEAAFHRWLRDQMKLFEGADKNVKN